MTARAQAARPGACHQGAVGGIGILQRRAARVRRTGRMRGRQGRQARQLLFDLCHRQFARCDGRGNRGHRFFLGRTRADRHHHVGARHQGAHGGLAGAVAVGNRVHVHAVGDHHALVVPLLAQDAGEDGVRHRGRVFGVERRVDDVGGHHGRRRRCFSLFALRRHPERRELEAFQLGHRLVDGGQGPVRVDMGVAMPGEVLDAAGHALGFAARHPGQGDARGGNRVGAEGTLGDDRIVRVVVQVQHRREVPVEAEPAHRARHRRADLERQFRIVGGAEGHRRRRRRHPGRAHHGAAFLVEGDQGLFAHDVLQGAGKARQLRGIDHVLAEQAGAADAVRAQEGGGVLVQLGAEQAHHDQLAGDAPQFAQFVHGLLGWLGWLGWLSWSW